LTNLSIAVASLLEEDVNVPTSPSTSELLVLTLLLDLVAEDDECCSLFTGLGITLPSMGSRNIVAFLLNSFNFKISIIIRTICKLFSSRAISKD
jgi:hypothetical protein